MKKQKRRLNQILRLGDGPQVRGQAYGVEVELENVRGWFEGPGDWTIVGDGSLRNDGMEFLTPPANADTVMDMIRELYQHKEAHGWTGGPRCGIHIHMDMTRKTVRQIQAFCVAYACVEPVIFSLCGADREQNIFCIPWYRAQTALNTVREFFYRCDRGTLTGIRARQPKYSALYLEPLTRFGTVEFRGAPVYDTVAEFGQLLYAFGELLESTLDADPEEIVDLFSHDPDAGLRAFMPTGRGLGALIDEADAQGVAAGLVRTNPLPPVWEFLGLNVDDTAPLGGVGPGPRNHDELMEIIRRMDDPGRPVRARAVPARPRRR